MKIIAWIITASFWTLPAASWAQREAVVAPASSASSSVKKRAKPAPAAEPLEDEEDEAIEPEGAKPEAGSGGTDRGRLEAYLRQRQSKVRLAHKVRSDFMGREHQLWDGFWNKTKEERLVFELRIARQRLDLLESLHSLDAKDHPGAIADFERLQANMIKSFENQQKQKMQDFFSQREARWKEFALEQEKERAEFAAEGDWSWQAQKTRMMGGGPEPQARSGK